jgi:hypothetical protein
MDEEVIVFDDAFQSGYYLLINANAKILDKLKNDYTVSYKIKRMGVGISDETNLGIFLGLSNDRPVKLHYIETRDGPLQEWANTEDQCVIIFRKIPEKSSRMVHVTEPTQERGSRSRSRSKPKSKSRSKSPERTATTRSPSRSGSTPAAIGGRSKTKRKYRKSRR